MACPFLPFPISVHLCRLSNHPDELIKSDGIAVFSEIKMTEIERMFNDGMALWNIYDAYPLRHKDDECCHQIIILV